MERRDLEILIECVEEAQRTKSKAAEVIADCITIGQMPSENQVRAYKLACMAVDATKRDLENCMTIAATVAAEEG